MVLEFLRQRHDARLMLETLLIYLREHGIKYLGGAAFGAVAWCLNVSLNILTEGRLFIRTILAVGDAAQDEGRL